MANHSARATLGCVVRAGKSYQGKQGPNCTPGISADSVGSQALWLGSVTLPPRGGRTKAHLHDNHESAFYLLGGEEVELWTGEQLEHRDVAHAGDYLYIPAGVPHVAVNRGETPAVFVGAQTDPNEQKSAKRSEDVIAIRVYFELETRAPWFFARDVGMNDLWVDLLVDSDDLRAAASSLRGDLAKFPPHQA